jgi:photosystem II stability/assembly factor-like uncharacterized protein
MNHLSKFSLTALLVSSFCTVQAQIPWVVAPAAPFTNPRTYMSFWPYASAMQLQANGKGWVYFSRPLGRGNNELHVALTSDNGQTWQDKGLAGGALGTTNAVVGTPANDVYNIVDNGTSARIEYSRANSTTWTTSFNTAGVTPKKIGFFDEATGLFIATVSGSPDVRVYRTTDAGVSWSALPLSLPAVPALIVLGTSVWLPTGTGQVWHSADAGQTWTTWNSDWSAFTSSWRATTVCFHDEFHGLAIGANNQLFRTVDSGRNWTAVAATGPTRRVVAEIIISPVETVPDAYVKRDYLPYGLHISTDAGSTWQVLDTTNNYTQLQLRSLSQGWAINGDGIQGMPFQDFMYLNSSVLASKSANRLLATAYPNPTTGRLQVPGSAGYTARVFDTTGRLAFAGTVAGDAVLDLSGCRPGLYRVQLIDQKGATSFQQIAVTR